MLMILIPDISSFFVVLA